MLALGVPLGKVTAFITRGPAEARELLVFRHPHAGVQIPAGTVEEGEPAESAAVREVWEETGLTAVSIVAHLESEQTPLQPDLRAVLRRVGLRKHPVFDSPIIETPSWFLGVRRGLFVRQISDVENGFAQVAYEEYDGPAHLADSPSRRVTGWVEEETITPMVIRHFFHLIPTEPTLDTWVQNAEEWEFRFELFWTPLLPSAQIEHLVPSQAAWLNRYADRLLAGSR